MTITNSLSGLSFNISYNKIINSLLPKRYRKNRIILFLTCLTFPMYRFWYNIFLPYREESLKQIRINASTIVLEKWLNYIYNQTDIQIVNTAYTFQLTYLYNKSEIGNATPPTYLYNKSETPLTSQVYLYNKSETIIKFDFIVKVPLILLNTGVTQQQIKSIIDTYKPLGVTYDIEVI